MVAFWSTISSLSTDFQETLNDAVNVMANFVGMV